MVKYIANSAAKNMSSEDSQTIVPTLTRFGLRDAWAVVVEIADAVATGSIIAAEVVGPPHGPPIASETPCVVAHMCAQVPPMPEYHRPAR
jgi:hypothetical protein